MLWNVFKSSLNPGPDLNPVENADIFVSLDNQPGWV